MENRIHFDPREAKWIVLEQLLEAGGSLYKELEQQRFEKTAQRQRAKRKRASREDALRTRDPW